MRESSAVGLLVLNLDGFRHTNDTLGHQTGDALLVEVAARLNAAAGDSETVARLGGDTFGILIERCRDRTQTQARADRYLREFRYPFGTGDREDRERISLGASIGMALARHDADGFEMLLARADAACFAAKDAGGGRAAFFDIAVEETFAEMRLLQNDLQSALTRKEFVLYFQPHVDLATRHIGGAEALIRWQHPTRGMVEPNGVHSVRRTARTGRRDRRVGYGRDRARYARMAARRSRIPRVVQSVGCRTARRHPSAAVTRARRRPVRFGR